MSLFNIAGAFQQKERCKNRRYFKIADITIQLESDIPVTEGTFHKKFKRFEVRVPGNDKISIRHYFSLPDLEGVHIGKELYRQTPWAIYKNNETWIYLGISSDSHAASLYRVAVFNHDHSRGLIYNRSADDFLKGNLDSLTLFPTDQILIARILAQRNGCYLHSCGVNLVGKGFLFVGHSSAGKSTMARMFAGEAEILCDDRIIVRRCARDFKIYGTWNHGDVSEISSGSAP